MNEDVIDGHGHAVLTDRVVLVHQDGQAQFRTDTVGTADQDRLFNITVHQRKEAAKTAEVPKDFWTVRSFYRIFHQFDGFIACVDIDTGIGIGQSFICVREHIFLLPRSSAAYP